VGTTTIHLGPTKKSAPSAQNDLKFCEIAFSHLNLHQLSLPAWFCTPVGSKACTELLEHEINPILQFLSMRSIYMKNSASDRQLIIMMKSAISNVAFR
jgi:hypothetical protein